MRVIGTTYAQRFRVEENFSQAFFCHCLGGGKFQAKLFFAIVSGNPAGVGVVGGGLSASLGGGLLQGGGGGRGAAGGCGGGEGPGGGGGPHPPRSFSVRVCSNLSCYVGSIVREALRFAASLRPPPWRRPSPR